MAAGQVQPLFLVPQFSTELTVTALSTVPSTFGVYDPSGSHNEVSTNRTEHRLTLGGRLTPGPWDALFAVPTAIEQEAPAGSATVAATVRTAVFDAGVTGPGGAPLVTSSGFSPTGGITLLAPGAAGTLTAVITARAPVGTVVAGFLAVETIPQALDANLPFLTPLTYTGDVLALFPYRYVVGAAPTTTPTPEPTPTDTPAPTSSDVVPIATGATAPSTPSAPPPTLTTSARPVVPSTGGSHASGTLPDTGADARTPAVLGVSVLMIGTALFVAARRRRPAGPRRP